VLATLAIALLAACGSSSTSGNGNSTNPSEAPFTAPTLAPALPTPTASPQQEYALLVDYLNSAIVVFQSANNSPNLTPSQLASAAAALEAQFKTFDSGLLAYQWPANTEADVKKLVQLDQAVEQDYALAASGGVTQATLSSWETQQARDDNVEQAQAKIVRGDLGLGLT